MTKSPTETCPVCNGNGTLWHEVIFQSRVEEFEYQCEECEGTGEIDIEDDMTA